MKVNIEMKNLENILETAMTENMETIVKEEVKKTVMQTVEDQAKKVIQEVCNQKLREFTEEYIKDTKITVGGGLYSKEKAETYTVEEYVRKELAGILESKSLKIPQRNRYGEKNGFETVSFEDFIKDSFDAEILVKNELSGFIKDMRVQINSKVNETFTDVTKNLLSETVFNVLMQNDTFMKINESIKGIADKVE